MVKRRYPDCYAYIRGYYRVPAYVGVRITRAERHGVLVDVKQSTPYLYVRFDDTGKTDILHPTDRIEYEIVKADQWPQVQGDACIQVITQ